MNEARELVAGLGVQRLPVCTRAPPEKFPRFRGVLAVKQLWRIRTGDCRSAPKKTPPPAFVSVAELGGSDSLQRRAGSDQDHFSTKAIELQNFDDLE